MIVKDRNPFEHNDSDRMAAAGAKAESQMAFYLKRAFADAADVLVFHDLRLANQDGIDATQIDHLVLHSGGMVIIESKSVSTQVQVNEHKEFSRLWDGNWQGFKSPVQQSKLQAEFLQKALSAKGPELLDKALFGLVQKGFGMVPFDILVAISDSGTITRKVEMPEVLKADQVVDKIREIMAARCVSFASFMLKTATDGRWIGLSASEMKRIADFLVASHRPIAQNFKIAPVVPQAAVTSVPALMVASQSRSMPTSLPQQVRTAEKPTCKHCSSDQVNVIFGRNYYLKCLSCGQNTPISYSCPKCGKDARIRKEKVTFYRECLCGHAEVYHVNGA